MDQRIPVSSDALRAVLPPDGLVMLSLCFISFVNGGTSSFGIKKVDRLNKSRKILYRSLKVDLKY